MRDFDGYLYTQDQGWNEDNGKAFDPAQWGIKTLVSEEKAGLSRKQGIIHRGQNSGYQALNLAYLLGAERIILVGYDMMKMGNQRHWFGAHPAGLEVDSNYGAYAANFATIKPADYGIEIWNCSRRSALKCFPMISLDEALATL